MPVAEQPPSAVRALLHSPGRRGPTDPRAVAEMQAQYFGMISEVDAQLARVWPALHERGDWDNTVIVVTADHAEQLGDQGLIQKAGYFESSYAILGIVRDPQVRSRRCRRRLHREHRHHADVVRGDGHPRTDPVRRVPADAVPARRPARVVARRRALRMGLARRASSPAATTNGHGIAGSSGRTSLYGAVDDRAFVHFGDGSWRCFDLAADPTWQTEVTDPEVVLAEAAGDAELAIAQPRPDDDRHAVAGRRHRPPPCSCVVLQ